MSLMLLDPFFNSRVVPHYRWSSSPRRVWDPIRDMDSVLSLANAMMNKIEDHHLGQMDISEDGKFQFGCDIGGFQPEELKVDLEDDDVVVQGEHKHQDDRQSIHKTFVRRFKLPEGVDKSTIKCDLDEKGRLQIYGQKLALEESQKKSIPIEHKNTGGQENKNA